jgi:predicted outer membrane repeat protein
MSTSVNCRLFVLMFLAAASAQLAAAQSSTGDGRRSERPAAAQGNGAAPTPEELIQMFDADGDGRISRAEAPPRMQQRFEQIDTNHDGYITLSELKARDARMGQMRGAARGGGAGGTSGQGGMGGAPGGRPAESAHFRPNADFSVITVGTGSPRYDPKRSGPCALVQYRGSHFLVDMGNGTQANLYALGVTTRQLDALILTHHHLDHNEEFVPLVIHTRIGGRQSQIIGPPGTKKFVDFILDFYHEDMKYRMERMGRTIADLSPPAVRELQGGESFQLGDVKVTTTRVNHSIHTVAYRFDVGGQSIVVTGDLSYTEGLVKLARGADVMVIDCGGAPVWKGQSTGGGDGAGRMGPGGAGGGHGGGAARAGDAAHAHGSRQDVCNMAEQAGVKRLVLTHIAPGDVDEAATKHAVGELYHGEVIVGHDLLEIAPRAKATAVRQLARFSGTDEQTPPENVAVPGGAGSASVELAQGGTGSASGNARVIYVRAHATAHGNGRSWAKARSSVQAGIDAAAAQGGGEVWVGRGVYKPTAGDDRSATFRLRSGVAVYGGFAGTETDRSRRDWRANQTILSGDIGEEGVAADNCYHVVTGADNAVLDGFIIRDGYGLNAHPGMMGPPGGQPGPGGMPGAGGAPIFIQFQPGDQSGGAGGMGPGGMGAIHTTPQAVLSGANPGSGAGMLNFQCAPTVRHCRFQNNQAGKGGAMYNMNARSFPPRRDVLTPAPTVINCDFLDNHARGRGGAVADDLGTSPTFRGCKFVRNVCDEKGGAIYNDFGCSPTVVNCLFAANRAASAAAMGNDGGSSPRIVHCTFSRNQATDEGAAIYQGTGPANNPVVVGCILWGDRCDCGPAEVFNWHDNDPQVSGCCVQGGYPGRGNIDEDPRFTAPEKGDFRPADDSPCRQMGYTAATSDELLAKIHVPQPVRPQPREEAAAPSAPPSGPLPILYVRAAGSTRGNGKSWRTAFRSLQDALAAAAQQPAEIWVSAGTYKPTAGSDRAAAFCLLENVPLYGGFHGNETTRDQRDWTANVTILSGDIGRKGDASDNSYHVVVGADGAVLDGFVIRDGNADGRTYDGKGGAMINYRRAPQSGPMGAATGLSPIVRNCSFVANHAHEGGAVYNYDRGAPQFSNCRFAKNSADAGGAMVDRVGVTSRLAYCTFEKNQAKWRAGALYLDYGARPKISDCTFADNRCDCHGGAVALVSRASQLESTIPLFWKCTFKANHAAQHGGAIAAADQCVLGLSKCVFAGNEAARGPAIDVARRSQAVTIRCRFDEQSGGAAAVTTDAASTHSEEPEDWPDQTLAPRSGPPGP